jgi:hypothetical protein
MNGIEAFSLRLADLKHLQAQNGESGVLQDSENVAGSAFFYGVRFDNAERSLQRLHSSYKSFYKWK